RAGGEPAPQRRDRPPQRDPGPAPGERPAAANRCRVLAALPFFRAGTPHAAAAQAVRQTPAPGNRPNGDAHPGARTPAARRALQRLRGGGDPGPGAGARQCPLPKSEVLLAFAAAHLSGAFAAWLRGPIRPAPAHV